MVAEACVQGWEHLSIFTRNPAQVLQPVPNEKSYLLNSACWTDREVPVSVSNVQRVLQNRQEEVSIILVFQRRCSCRQRHSTRFLFSARDSS